MQILILGMHRSGTSLTTRLVTMMGAYFGPEMGIGEKTVDNPKGFWEHPEVFRLNDAILAAKNCRWNDLRNWKFDRKITIPEKLDAHIQRIVRLMNTRSPWVLKDPRHCLLLPAWRPHLNAPLAVIVHRDPLEIALSLRSRDGFPIEYGIALWEYYAVGMIENTRGMPCVFTQHRRLLQEPSSACDNLFEQLVQQGVQSLHMPGQSEIEAFVDAGLYRAKAAGDEGYALTPHQQEVNDIIQGLCPAPDHIEVSEASRNIILRGLAA